MLVVASSDYAMQRIAEGDREDSHGIGTLHYRRVEDLPRLTTVGRVENASGLAASGEPDVAIIRRRKNGHTAIRGRECAFSCGRFRQLRRWYSMPRLAIFGFQQFKLQFAGVIWNGIAQHDTMLGIPEGDGIKKSLGIAVGVSKLPML